MTEKKPQGPPILKKAPKKAQEDEPKPEEKHEFTQLTPPGVEDPRQKAAQGSAAFHQAEAAAARAEDRANQEPAEEEEEPSADGQLDEAVEKFINQFQPDDQLMTPEQRELIEAQLEPIDLGQIFTLQEFRQHVPIVKGKFEVEYRSISGAEDDKLKYLLSKEDPDVSARYLTDKYACLSLICTVRSINAKEFPIHYTPTKGWNQKKFDEKGKLILSLPAQAVWSLMVHASWFDRRCKELFKVSEIKNG